ncbi:unnamed protein product [Moneuplotes crassus]|uniref:Uncharacterized protein n=1 Tax=Euplotes crassus TaxID=5936 RepID=A0AAD1UT35_EUPCR|nr:unnamed protein product [Moneuplotes crassus]CAI2370946.1 unnamed protein product [Moneuplotes crassus]
MKSTLQEIHQKYEESKKEGILSRFRHHCKSMRGYARIGMSQLKSHQNEFSWRVLRHKSLQNWKSNSYYLNFKRKFENQDFMKLKMFSLILVLAIFCKFRKIKSCSSLKRKYSLSAAYLSQMALRLDRRCCSSAHLKMRFFVF